MPGPPSSLAASLTPAARLVPTPDSESCRFFTPLPAADSRLLAGPAAESGCRPPPRMSACRADGLKLGRRSAAAAAAALAVVGDRLPPGSDVIGTPPCQVGVRFRIETI